MTTSQPKKPFGVNLTSIIAAFVVFKILHCTFQLLNCPWIPKLGKSSGKDSCTERFPTTGAPSIHKKSTKTDLSILPVVATVSMDLFLAVFPFCFLPVRGKDYCDLRTWDKQLRQNAAKNCISTNQSCRHLSVPNHRSWLNFCMAILQNQPSLLVMGWPCSRQGLARKLVSHVTNGLAVRSLQATDVDH